MDNKLILIDTTLLFDQYAYRGIGRTGKEILLRLIPLLIEADYEIHLAGFETLEKNLIQIGFSQFALEEIIHKIKFTSFGPAVPSGIRNIARWNQTFKNVIEEVQPAIFFAPHFERGLPTVNRFRRSLKFVPKTAVICYDIIPIKTNKFSNKDPIRNLIKKYLYMTMWGGVVNADLIFTISNFSKSEIVSLPEINPEKVKVIHLGISQDFYKKNINSKYNTELVNQVLDLYELKENEYFFYDSGIESNKGIFDLIDIFSDINSKSKNSSRKLVIVGKDFEKGSGSLIKARNIPAEEILKYAKQKDVLKNIVTTDKLSERDLLILLSRAAFYINLSKYEGFGLGIAQAFAAEVPVIASNFSSYPEIAQDAALLVDTKDKVASVQEIQNFMDNQNEIKSNVMKGIEVVKGYDWDVTAKNYFNEINALVN